jgi:hypothetical protein
MDKRVFMGQSFLLSNNLTLNLLEDMMRRGFLKFPFGRLQGDFNIPWESFPCLFFDYFHGNKNGFLGMHSFGILEGLSKVYKADGGKSLSYCQNKCRGKRFHLYQK